MIGLGLASSHAPAMFCPREVWPKVYAAIPDYTKQSQPHTARNETPEVIDRYIARIDAGFEVLRRQIESYEPDAVIFVGDDQNDLFSRAVNPALCVFVGEEVWGSSKPFYMPDPPESSRIHLKVHRPLAKLILEGLLERGFDPAASSKMQPLGDHPERGVSHMIVYPARRLMPRLDVPIIPVFLNAYYPPLPSAQRCWDLGEALADILKDRPERIAIYGSGGLSHDPVGPRAGWIDEPLDRWVLSRIEQNKGKELTRLFTFDSDTLRGGTGEIRAWITAAGACPRPGTVVDYWPVHHAKAGVGFAYWPPIAADTPRSART